MSGILLATVRAETNAYRPGSRGFSRSDPAAPMPVAEGAAWRYIAVKACGQKLTAVRLEGAQVFRAETLKEHRRVRERTGKPGAVIHLNNHLRPALDNWRASLSRSSHGRKATE